MSIFENPLAKHVKFLIFFPEKIFKGDMLDLLPYIFEVVSPPVIYDEFFPKNLKMAKKYSRVYVHLYLHAFARVGMYTSI